MSLGVHNIHITTNDAEYNALIQAKGDLTWHDYLCREI